MSELELQEDTYQKLNQIVETATSLKIGSSLTWIWVWDIVKYNLKEGVSEREVFTKLWESADKEGFTIEYGSEAIQEHITDWLVANDFHESCEDDSDIYTEVVANA